MPIPKCLIRSAVGFGLWLGVIGCSTSTVPTPDKDSAAAKVKTPTIEKSESVAPPLGDQPPSIDVLIQSAEEALAAGQWDKARESLRRGLLIQPDSSRLRFLSAQAEANDGNLDEAIAILASIDNSDPDFGIASLGQAAQWLASAGRATEARNMYEKTLELAPDVDFLRHQYAAFLNFVGWRYRARDVLEPLVKSGQANTAELRSLLDVSNSFAATQATSTSGTANREGPLSESLGRLSHRQPRIAIEILQAMLKQGLMDRESTTDAAIAAGFAELQQFDEMAQWLDDSSPDVTNNPMYWRTIGDQRFFDGRADEAVACYLKSIDGDCTNPIVYERLTAAMLRLGDDPSARRIDGHRELLLSISQVAEAIVTQTPSDDSLAVELADKLEQAGQPDQAAAWLSWFRTEYPELVNSAAFDREILRLRSIDANTIETQRFVGISPKAYPEPSAIKLPTNDGSATKESLANTDKRPFVRQPTLATFVDVAESTGLVHEYKNANPKRLYNFRIFEGLGGGIAAFDFDRDGRVDFYCSQAGCEPPLGLSSESNQLYRNLDGHFRNATEIASLVDRNYTQCVTTGDINQDGFDDVLVGNLGFNRMLINQGDGTFRDISESVGWTNPDTAHCTMGLAIADITGDAIADVVEVNYVNSPLMYEPSPVGPDGGLVKIPGPLHFPAEVDRLWIQTHDGKFEPMNLGETATSAGHARAAEFGDSANPGLGMIISNFDDDPANEIFVANDARPNQLWKQQQSAKQLSADDNELSFEDIAVARGCAVSSRGEACACMGVAWADFDRNGSPDMIITNWFDEWLNFYLGDSSGNFRDVAPRFGLDKLSENLLGFGCQAIDFDNDATVDVFVANGHIDNVAGAKTALAMPAQLIQNLGDRFLLAEQSAETFWQQNHVGRAAITADHNRDGQMDIAVVDLLAPVALLENQTQTNNHWIQFVIVGVESERGAIGTRIEVSQGTEKQVAVTATGDGYQGRSEAVVPFGLGSSEAPVGVKVIWPSGVESYLPSLRPDTRYLIVEGQSEPWADHLR
ncbi:FG-GAP-like repeat-containing protein [Rubripirellula reticaptiva]|uniref:Tetratricopeptide repeat protein n=1 Tax=Rubripirellula reticaptiva TaxID=2528013 RepID=A0A5C6EG51_9BACT|nr:FG-GAP-like repeat-containing protein [Rubripirellula reticaptiva]TWU47798.1 tetratricopeptide repeat protein [Rubripirellula reticaptiva]